MANSSGDERWPLFGDSLQRLQGSPDLQMPPSLAHAMTAHLEELREKYVPTCTSDDLGSFSNLHWFCGR